MPKKYSLFLVTLIALLALDQVTKVYIAANMSLHQSFTVIDGLFSITYVRNPGAAFGFLASASPAFRYVFFLTVTVIAIVLILYYLSRSPAEDQRATLSLSLILSGALGNLIDRVRFGEVIDFLDVYIGMHHWPAFNVADSAISIGAAILLIEVFRRGKERQTAKTSCSLTDKP